jgi:hypothetical protein
MQLNLSVLSSEGKFKPLFLLMSERKPHKLAPSALGGWESYAGSHEFPGIRVGMSNVGRGVFADRPFRKGERVLTFHGPILEGESGMALSDTVQIDWDRYVDPVPPVKYVNHHCEPNTGLNNGVELIALRDIGEGEEIRFDYSTCMGEENWTMECKCGSPHCRHLIADFALLPAPLQTRYIGLGIVQPFLIGQTPKPSGHTGPVLIG